MTSDETSTHDTASTSPERSAGSGGSAGDDGSAADDRSAGSGGGAGRDGSISPEGNASSGGSTGQETSTPHDGASRRELSTRQERSTQADTAGTHPGDPVSGRRRLTAEIWIVLGLSVGQSAVYATISLIAKLTADRPLSQQRATLNASRSTREYLDLALQLAGIAFALVPVALALWLLSGGGRSALRRIGVDRSQPWRDLAYGVGLSAVIGLPGLGLYAVGRALNLTTTIVPAALNDYWWTVPVLVLSAVQNAILEEVIAVGYLVSRLEDLRWSAAAIVGVSAVLRGSYHLYQGFGPFLGNAVMGLIFAEWFRRKRRIAPLIIAHTILDVVAFVGYHFVGDPWS